MNNFIETVNTAIMSSNIQGSILVYIGVGTAAGTYIMVDDKKVVEPTNYHQYPKVLRDMQNISRANLKKYILLIDPMMESPPHITTDNHNGFNFRPQSDNVYVDYENQIHLQILRENVTHDVYRDMYHGDGHNITHELSQLIEICKSEYVNMIYHDFSGRPLLPIYEYHQEHIADHANHIVIGLGAQGDFGCYFDMTSDVASFAMKPQIAPNRRNYIDICSPRYYLASGKTIEQALDDYPHCNSSVLCEQFTRICKDKFDELISKVFYKLRFLKQIQSTSDEELGKITSENLVKMYDTPLGLQIYACFENRNFDMAFIHAVEFYGPKYSALCLNSGLQMSGTDLIYRIVSSAKDVYSWAAELRKIMEY